MSAAPGPLPSPSTSPAARSAQDGPVGGTPPSSGGATSPGLVLDSVHTPTLTKAHMADLLFEHIGLNKREAKDMVEAFFEIVHTELVAGRDVKISGFGHFGVQRKGARPGRNPRTGEAVQIEARQVVTFRASQRLKDIVQGDLPADAAFE